MSEKGSMEAVTALVGTVQEIHPIDHASVILRVMMKVDLFCGFYKKIKRERKNKEEERIARRVRLAREGSEAVEDNSLPTPVKQFSTPAAEENANEEAGKIKESPKRRRKNRQAIEEVDYEDVKRGAERLKTGQIFTSSNDKQLQIVDFTRDIKTLGGRIHNICKAYANNKNMAFFAEIERAITSVTYHLQMETLKKIKLQSHTDMLMKIKKEQFVSPSELSRLKILGSRVYQLLQKCGMISLALVACVSCGRIIEVTNLTFQQFLEMVCHDLEGHNVTAEFEDEYLVQFKEFYQQSVKFIQ